MNDRFDANKIVRAWNYAAVQAGLALFNASNRIAAAWLDFVHVTQTEWEKRNT